MPMLAARPRFDAAAAAAALLALEPGLCTEETEALRAVGVVTAAAGGRPNSMVAVGMDAARPRLYCAAASLAVAGNGFSVAARLLPAPLAVDAAIDDFRDPRLLPPMVL